MQFLREVIAKGADKFQAQLIKAFRSIGAAFVSQQKRERLRGGTAPGKLRRRSSRLSRSVGHFLEGDTMEKLRVTMGYGPPAQAFADDEVAIYAAVHGAPGGTTIRAAGQYLAIPIADNLTPSGLANFDSPYDLGDARFVPWLGDTFLVFDGNSLMFKLQREVFIEQRLDVPADWAAFQPIVEAKLKDAVGKAVKILPGGSGG